MRNLKIKRRKSFVASLARMKVYIEDNNSEDNNSEEVVIGGTSCRKLGVLKNGEEKTFQIPDESLKVFVISDYLSKGFSNEFYQLPEGTEDICLEGENKYNPATGNSFVFDNNDNPEAISNRKKSARIGVIVLIIAGIVGFIIGFLNAFLENKPTGEDVTFHEAGMTIVLNDYFSKFEDSDATISFSSPDVSVFGNEQKFSSFDGFEDYTLEEYAKGVIAGNDVVPNNTKLQTKEGILCFEYDYTDDGPTIRYYTFLYKEYDAFWFVQFALEKEDCDKYYNDILTWAKSVSFDK